MTRWEAAVLVMQLRRRLLKDIRVQYGGPKAGVDLPYCNEAGDLLARVEWAGSREGHTYRAKPENFRQAAPGVGDR